MNVSLAAPPLSCEGSAAKLSMEPPSLVPNPLHARARKGLVKRVALTRPVGMQ